MTKARKSNKEIKEEISRVNEKHKPLDRIYASDLSDEFTPPDEILEDLLIAGDGSVIYGDSNSGKTFLAVDMGASISRGSQWLGKRTDPGLVIYLAVESPASIKRRLQSYKKYHNIKLDNFIMVPNPIDLFSNDGDTSRIISLVKEEEAKRKQKVRLIIGDTLARLSPGANENSGEHMSVVIKHFDIIRSETEAHFTLIHHSGKNAANGARGWSGIRAAIDTEMEVTDSKDGHCLEVTKQRDLATKGMRIGFRLEPVILGNSKWGKPTGSCVVLPWNAPVKEKGKKLGKIAGGILEFMRNFYAENPGPLVKSTLVSKMKGDYQDSSIYREIRKLVALGEVIDFDGFINFI